MAEDTQERERIFEEQRKSLNELFSEGSSNLGTLQRRGTRNVAVGGLDQTLKAWSEFASMVKGYVVESRSYGQSIGLKMRGMQDYTALEKFLNWIPVFGDGLADKHFNKRLSNTSLEQDIGMFLDNCELYAQGIELARQDLEHGKQILDAKQEELIASQKQATDTIDEYAPLLEQEVKSLNDIMARLAKAPEAERPDLEMARQQAEGNRDKYEKMIGNATFQRKSAQEQYEYAIGIEENFRTLVRTLEHEGVILNTITEHSSVNMAQLAKGLAAMRIGAGGVKIYDMASEIQSEGIKVLGEGTATLAAETSKILTEDMYDKEKLAASIEKAKQGRDIIRGAIRTALEKYQAGN